jgi:SulP family sulfate permease
LQRKGKHIILSGPHTQPLLVMEQAGFLDRIGRENVCAHLEASLNRAREILGLPPAPTRSSQIDDKSLSGEPESLRPG